MVPPHTETLTGVQGEKSGSSAGLRSAQIMAPEEWEHTGQKGPVQRSTIKTKAPSRFSPQPALGPCSLRLHPFVLLGEQ